VALVSFVIPVCNQDAFVGRAIDSVLGQTHTPVEVIVIDDGSTDGTATVLADYKARPNVTIVRQANGGVAAARNRGLASSRGEFVCFLDADDFLAPAFAARLLAALVDRPQAGFAYCEIQRVDRFGEPADALSVAASRTRLSGNILDSLILGEYFTSSSTLVRRAALDAVGNFDLALGGHADYELWLRIVAAGHEAAFVNDRLAFYRLHPASMSHDVEGMRASRISALQRVASRSPQRVAEALADAQDAAADLISTNARLSGRWSRTVMTRDADAPNEAWSLIEHIHDARPSDRSPHRFAIWNVTVAGYSGKTIFLHPPGTVEATIPTGAAGQLTTAVALHPDAWPKRDAGVCQFSVLVDGRVSASAVVDPARHEPDRRWVELNIDVPASATDHHLVTIETSVVDVDWYCHALFRDVVFTKG
jgi:hypothetical protein